MLKRRKEKKIEKEILKFPIAIRYSVGKLLTHLYVIKVNDAGKKAKRNVKAILVKYLTDSYLGFAYSLQVLKEIEKY